MRRAVRILLWLTGGIALVGVLCAAGLSYLLYTPAPRSIALSGATSSQTIRVGALARSYLLYTPTQLSASPPLVVAFHGSMGSGADMRVHSGFQFDRLADENGFLVAYPNGYDGHWNDCRRVADYAARALDIDDVGFFSALVGQLQQEKNIDPQRVYVVGVSNGAHFVFRLALEQPQSVAAAAVFSANLPTPENSICERRGEPPPILIVNGTADPINPYNGGVVTLFGFGNRGDVISAEATAQYFAAQRNAGAPVVTLSPSAQSDPTSAERTVWLRNGAADVELITVRGGGHMIPQPISSAPRLLGRMTISINGPEEAWRFFAER